MTIENGNTGRPIPYITAVWSGMPATDIEAGLAAGTILGPGGAPGAAAPYAAALAPLADSVASLQGNADSVTTDPHATRAQVEAWFEALDPAVTSDTLDSLWQHAGGNDSARADTLQRFLAETLLGDAAADAASIAAFVADPAHRAQVVDLHGMTGADLAGFAKQDIGYRHALATLQPMALTGNRALFMHANANGALDRFDPDSGEQLASDAWLADRAKLLAWKSADTGERVIAGNEDWTFVDRTAVDANGDPSTFELSTGSANAGRNQVVFGNGSNELLQGVSGSDRIYGGDGSDILRGGAGGDHLEGGRGDDLVLGGSGNDELTGDQGDDELDGGRGDDRLDGGSGNDILIGGRGNDRLHGGTGRDVYVIDEGDGSDTIVDADGVGIIELDGADIGGTMRANERGGWSSANGQLELSLAGDPSEAGTLTIRAFAEGADHAGTPTNIVTVRNWKNGDLGITLGATPATGSVADPEGDLASITGPEVPVLGASDLPANEPAGETSNANAASWADMNANVAWGDVAPVGVGNGGSWAVGSPEATGAAMDAQATSGANDAAAATADSAADAHIGAADTSSASVTPFDDAFAEALAAIFGADPAGLATLQPSHVASAIQAFSGVLEAPDITAAVGFGDSNVANAITAHDYADALAGDYAGDDIGNESAMAMRLPMVPEVRSSETPFDQFRDMGAGR